MFGDPAALRVVLRPAERDASKGLADYRMLVRKLPDELVRRTRARSRTICSAARRSSRYLDNLDWAIGAQITEMGEQGTFDVFSLARRAGHRLALACWLGREASVDPLIADMDVLDGPRRSCIPNGWRHLR